MSDMRQVWAASLWLLFYLAAAAICLWPLLPVMGTHLPHYPTDPDLQMGVWLPWHVVQQLSYGKSPFFAPGLMYPDGLDLTLYTWNLGCQLVVAPLFLFFAPILAFNLSIIFLAALNGLAGHAFGAAIGGGRLAAVITGLLATWAFEPMHELCSGRPEQGFVAPLLLTALFLHRVLGGGGRRDSVLLGLSMAATGACYWFHPYFLGICLAVPLALRVSRGQWDGRTVAGLALGTGVCLLAVLPAMLPVLRALAGSDSAFQRAMVGQFTEATLLSSRMQQSIPLTGLAWPWMRGTPSVDLVFPLAASLPLLGALVWRSARQRALDWLLLGIVALLLALGPRLLLHPGQPLLVGGHQLQLPAVLLDYLPGFQRFWWPRRWLTLASIGGLAATAATVGAMGAFGRRWGLGLGLGLLLLHAAELGHLAPHSRTAAGGGAVHEVIVPDHCLRLAAAPWTQPVLQVPLLRLPNEYILFQVFHQQPMFGTLAQNNPDLVPPALVARSQRSPFSAWLLQPGQDILSGAALRAALQAEGYRWVHLQNDVFPAGSDGLAWASALLGAPDGMEGALVFWDLARPAVAEIPVAAPSEP